LISQYKWLTAVFYSAIAKGQELICEYEIVAGPARAFAQVILQDISVNDDRKMSYIHEGLACHYITKSNGLTYFVVCKESLNRRVPFLFLMNLDHAFTEKYLHQGSTVDDVPATVKDFQTILQSMTVSAEKGETDTVGLAQSEIDQVKHIMIENVERVLERGERINLLVSKTDRMNTNAVAFRKRTVAVRRGMWWQNVKYTVLLLVVGIAVIYLCLGFVCGLPGFQVCFAHGSHDNSPQQPFAIS
jgi:vesicle-associated membrane protein 7